MTKFFFCKSKKQLAKFRTFKPSSENMHVVISSKLNFKQIGHELVYDIQTDEHTEITIL